MVVSIFFLVDSHPDSWGDDPSLTKHVFAKWVAEKPFIYKRKPTPFPRRWTRGKRSSSSVKSLLGARKQKNCISGPSIWGKNLIGRSDFSWESKGACPPEKCHENPCLSEMPPCLMKGPLKKWAGYFLAKKGVVLGTLRFPWKCCQGAPIWDMMIMGPNGKNVVLPNFDGIWWKKIPSRYKANAWPLHGDFLLVSIT